jgi:hypothetical protein
MTALAESLRLPLSRLRSVVACISLRALLSGTYEGLVKRSGGYPTECVNYTYVL